MILTEKEAKQKWCCASMPEYDPMKATQPANCYASECMAWRWIEETCTPDGKSWKGYCGLAGKLEVE